MTKQTTIVVTGSLRVKTKQWWPRIDVFRENRCSPPRREFSVFLQLWPQKLGQGHQNLNVSLLCPNYTSWNFGKNPKTGSQDFVQTRKCHADADADASINGIRTKINMHPLPVGGGHKIYQQFSECKNDKCFNGLNTNVYVLMNSDHVQYFLPQITVTFKIQNWLMSPHIFRYFNP